MRAKRYSYSRYAMYKHIETTLAKLSLHAGDCLLVGDTLNGKGGGCAILDMLPIKHAVAPDYPAVDVQNLPYDKNTYDFVIADQVIEHVRKPWVGVKEIYRVLKPGGIAIITSALIYRIHAVPNDYWRFTPNGLRVLCEDFSKIHVATGNGNLQYAINVLNNHKEVIVPGAASERNAVVNDSLNLVSVWIIAEK